MGSAGSHRFLGRGFFLRIVVLFVLLCFFLFVMFLFDVFFVVVVWLICFFSLLASCLLEKDAKINPHPFLDNPI